MTRRLAGGKAGANSLVIYRSRTILQKKLYEKRRSLPLFS